MRQRQFVVKVVLLMALVVGARQALPARQADPAQLAFEAARRTELVDRDLRGAIAQYRDVISRYGSNRAVVANSLLHLAGCLDQLGAAEARAIWERIVRDYPEQTAVVVEARTRLERSGTGRGQVGLVPRRVLEPDWAGLHDISADGRMGAGRIRAGWSAYSVVVRDLRTGRTRTLATGQQYRSVRISDDAGRVAFSGGGQSLHIVNTATGAVEAVIPAPPPHTGIGPLDWSPDGKTILVALNRDSGVSGSRPLTELAWLSIADLTIKPFWTFKPWQNPGGAGPLPASISRDGRFIAITAEAREGSSDRFVYVIDAEGRGETAVVTIAGSPGHPVWAPDDGALLFVKADSAPGGLWAVSMKNGRPTAEPRRIYPELGGALTGVTSSGILYYDKDIEGDGSGYGGNYVQLVRRGPESSGDPVTFPGWGPAWSPDGQSVAIVRDAAVVVRRIASGEERSYVPRNVVVSPRWLHDGSSLIVVTQSQPTRATGTFHRLDMKTGVIQRLFDVGQRSATGAISPDDRTIYLGKASVASGPFTSIVAVDLTTGVERPVANLPAGMQLGPDPAIAMSPDGRMLAIRVFAKPDVDVRILTLRIDGSNQHELVGTFASSWPEAVRWTKEGLLFVQWDANRNWRLMRVPAAGGSPVFDGLSYETLVPRVPKLRLSPGNFSGFDVSPDGTRIVLSTQTLTRSELWTLDNALSMVGKP